MERRTPTITITGTVITIIITGTTDITGITVIGTIDIGDIITGVIDKILMATNERCRCPPPGLSRNWKPALL